MRIVMIGPPGSGKGTQAAKLSEHMNLPHVSTGVMFREIRKQETPLGRMVKQTMDQGLLISDELVLQVLQNRMKKPDARNGFILDGYPRNLNQARTLENLTKADVAIEFVVRDEEVVRRISSRRTCENCNSEYNVIYFKPQNPGQCDECGGKLVQREDAKPEAVKERLRIYHEQTNPLSDYYKGKKILTRVNGEQPIQKVFDDIVKKINSKFKRVL